MLKEDLTWLSVQAVFDSFILIYFFYIYCLCFKMSCLKKLKYTFTFTRQKPGCKSPLEQLHLNQLIHFKSTSHFLAPQTSNAADGARMTALPW